MLNALSGELSAVQMQVASLLSSSSKDHPFTSADIHACLNTEQQLLNNKKAWTSNIVLAAAPACCKPNTPIVRRLACCVENKATPSKVAGNWEGAWGGSQMSSSHSTPHPVSAPRSPPSVHYDKSRCAYILDSVTSSAIFLASTHTAPTPPAPTVPPSSGGTSEFAGLAHDTILPEFLRNVSASNQFEFNALMAHVGDLTTFVNWHCHSAPFNFAHLNVAIPDQHVHTVINPSTEPFFIDTGASVHISNSVRFLLPMPDCPSHH
ncbi:hypothetical protein PAXRUDRAFT_16613 [Paxillus rubicundulus Ve08.2h10]|uniref:Uncharacterized protein n=1 Tax=Paxillus rubicundulus Ve08.2h10 TaxID=930991 RepID=A0A0D0CU31_9AGAM|nr:hypothetical protein PAXRUDRAFT_16613 [Paxillus rubicundulus Ve08.2h10]